MCCWASVHSQVDWVAAFSGEAQVGGGQRGGRRARCCVQLSSHACQGRQHPCSRCMESTGN
jgi:hypothetical protein